MSRVLLVISLLGVAACSPPPRTSIDASSARARNGAMGGRVVIEGPKGTLEIASFAVSGGHGLASLRDAASGLFAAWRLDVTNGSWERVSEPRFRYPTAIGGDGSRGVLVVDAQVGRCVATWLDGDRVLAEIDLEDSLVRSVAWDAKERCWWLGGAFGDDATSLVCRLDRDGWRVVEALVADPMTSIPPAEFTGLTRAGDRLLASSVLACSIASWDMHAAKAQTLARIDAALPAVELPCEVGSRPGTTEPSLWRDWLMSVDAPVSLFPSPDGVLLNVRRAARAGWRLIAFDLGGGVTASVDLPWDATPLGSDESILVVARRDLDEPGQPSHVEVLPTQDVLSGAARVDVRVEPKGPLDVHVVESARDLAELGPRLIVLVDPAKCIGDVQRELLRALAARDKEEHYTLAMMEGHGGDLGNLATVIGRHFVLEPPLLSWRTKLPADATVLGPGAYVWKHDGRKELAAD